ncbi:MAG: TlpA family protein disulfide reductase [Gammaproteobacteria bacterium]|nr:TlpA family protein disulfide reductase [Gammaproteobacteria bacterium]
MPRMKSGVTALRSLATLLTLAGSAAVADPANLAAGPWRGEIGLNGQMVPFNFEVIRESGSLAVHYLNGAERMPVELVSADGNSLAFDFPSFAATLRATHDGSSMRGTIGLLRQNSRHELPFSARQGPRYRFFATPSQKPDRVDGIWSMTISDPTDGDEEAAIATFTQQGAALAGSVLTATGDQRYLAGEMRDSTLLLSAFDGGGVRLWRGELGADGVLRGTLDTVTSVATPWIARRDANAALGDPRTMTGMKAGAGPLAFSYPDMDGRNVSLADAAYDGKVVLVILAGSWCATCHDEARVMGPIYAEYASRGLEVLYLMYEYTADFAAAKPQLSAWRRRFAIEHPMLFVGDTGRDTRGRSLPMLTDVVAFPTTIFVDRAGQVRTILTSFPGPATGEPHEAYKRDFRRTVEALLAEPPPANSRTG